MAIYHLTVKTITRSKGQSAVRSAAYRHAALMFDERLGKTEDYTHKKDVIHCEITIPPNSPKWLKDLISLESEKQNIASEKLWNIVELRERQDKSQVAREIEFALPIELNYEQSINLAREFITDQFALRGMIADWSVHWDEGNPHVHVMLTMRELNQNGFGNKCRIWNHKTFLNEWRKSWAEYANFHLRLNHYDVRIDHRSYQEQGIDLIPTIHQGKAVNDMERRGIKTSIMKEANQIKNDNLHRIAKNPDCLFKKVTSEHSSFTHENVIEKMSCYITDKAHYFQNDQKPHSKEKGALASETLEKLKRDEQSTEIKPFLTADAIKQILKNIEYHEAVFSEKEIARELSTLTDNAEIFARALIEVKASNEMIYLGLGEDGRDRYTTQRMFNVENKLQILSEQIHQRNHIQISERKLNHILGSYEKNTGFKLTEEQAQAVKHITDINSLSCLVGRAGTGKSFTLGAARVVWQAQGLNVYGVALSGVAASGLKQSAGIESRTIESFNHLVKEKKLHLTNKDVLVMDEAGMTDSVGMLNILEEVHKAKAKIVLVGDPQQLQPVGPGATFRAILERTGFSEIQKIYRQKVEWQKEATSMLASGDVTNALALYDKHDCLHFKDKPYDAKLDIVEKWLKLHKEKNAAINEILIITYKNADVAELNHMIRDERLKARDIEEGQLIRTVKGNLKISINDRLMMLKNDQQIGVKNGNFATVININKDEIVVKLDGIEGRIITINTQKYNQFDYGYAATIHKVQGTTVDHSLVFSSGFGWDKNLTYVALSRHRESCNIYTDKESHTNKLDFYNAHNKQQIKDSILDYPLAFAQRRGLDIGDKRSEFITTHLKARLQKFVKRVKDNIEEVFSPENYWAKKKELAKEIQDTKFTLQRRDDARLVARYVDSNRELGKAFEKYQTKLNQLGVQKLKFNSDIAHFVFESIEYKELYKAQIKRDEIAHNICKDLNRYKKALEIYGISHIKLGIQREQHISRMTVNDYADALRLGKIVIRDRLAAKITQNLKSHYGQFAQLKLDDKKLWNHANAHKRRAFIKLLDDDQRNAFYDVQKYQKLTRDAANLIEKAFKKKNVKNTKRKLTSTRNQSIITNKIYGIIKNRNELAQKILSNIELYQMNLDFHRIGVSSDLIKSNNLKLISSANARWYRLQEHAAKAINMQNNNPKSLEEKQWLRIAKRYQLINRQSGRAWSNIIKANHENIKITSYQKRKIAAESLIAKRNYLAHLFIEQKDKLSWLSDFKEIEPVDIDARLIKLKINMLKAEQHAKQYQKYVNKITEWRNLYDSTIYDLKQLTKENMPYSKKAHDDIIKILNRTHHVTKQLSENKNCTYALMSMGESLNSMKVKAKNLSQLQQVLQQFLLQRSQSIKISNIIVLDKDQKERILRAQNKAKLTVKITGTIAEKYLREHRNIKGRLPSSLRFSPSMYDSDTRKKYPALIAISKNILGKVQAIQVTYLDSITANKANIINAKKTYGVLNIGNPVVIINEGLNKERIVVAEGIETALSIKEANPNLRIYATLGSSNFKHVPVTEQTKSVLFCADNDGQKSSSQKLLKQASEALSMQGIDVWQIMPNVAKQDFNDVLKSSGIEAVKEYLKNPQLIKKGISPEKLKQDIEITLNNTIAGVNSEQVTITEELLQDKTKNAIINYIEKLEIYEEALSHYHEITQKGDKIHLNITDAEHKLTQVTEEILNNKEVWQEIELKSELSLLSLKDMGKKQNIITKLKSNTITKAELNAIKISIKGKGKSAKLSKSRRLKLE